MLKKYLFSLFVFVFSFLFINQVSAQTSPFIHSFSTSGTDFVSKYCVEEEFTSKQECLGYIVSGSSGTKYQDKVSLNVVDQDANQTLTVRKDGPHGPIVKSGISSNNCGVGSTHSSCTVLDTLSWNFALNSIQTQHYVVVDSSNAVSQTATYQITLKPAPITLTGKVGGVDFNWGKLDKKRPLTITCTNSENLEITRSGGELVAKVSAQQTGQYTLTYTFTDNSLEGDSYTVTCTNVGGEDTKQTRIFNTSPVTGSINTGSCKIPLNASSCTSFLNWTTQDAVGTSTVYSHQPNPTTTLSNSNVGTINNVEVFYPTRTFYLDHLGKRLGEATASSSCLEGVWDGTKCAGEALTDVSLSAEGCQIPFGASSCSGRVSWNVENVTNNWGLSQKGSLFFIIFKQPVLD